MKRAYKLEGHLCGNCAAKIEDKINKIDGVNKASVNFMMMKFTLDTDDEKHAAILEESKKAFRLIEPTCTVKA